MKTHASSLSKISNRAAYGLAAVLTLGRLASDQRLQQNAGTRRRTRTYGTGRASASCCTRCRSGGRPSARACGWDGHDGDGPRCAGGSSSSPASSA